jgi:hypothetical protein
MRVAVGQAFDLTRDEIWFLKALRAAGERGRIVNVPASRAALARLVEAAAERAEGAVHHH